MFNDRELCTKLFTLLFVTLMLISKEAGSDTDINDRIYVSNRQSLYVTRDKQITYGLHITSVEPSPSGTRLALVSQIDNGDGTSTSSVDTLGLEQYQVRKYCSTVEPQGDPSPYLLMGGWSPDSRFFGVLQATYNQGDAAGNYDPPKYSILACDLKTARTLDVADLVDGNPNQASASWNNQEIHCHRIVCRNGIQYCGPH